MLLSLNLLSPVNQKFQIFKDLSDLFSAAEVPLAHEVIPMLEAMEHDLTKVRDSSELPEVIRVAAIAGLLVISKYYALTDDNEVYRIAISALFCSSLIDFNICLTYFVCIVSYAPRQETSVV